MPWLTKYFCECRIFLDPFSDIIVVTKILSTMRNVFFLHYFECIVKKIENRAQHDHNFQEKSSAVHCVLRKEENLRLEGDWDDITDAKLIRFSETPVSWVAVSRSGTKQGRLLSISILLKFIMKY